MRKMMCMIVMIIFSFNIYAQEPNSFFNKCVEVQKFLRSKSKVLENQCDSLEHIVNRFSKRSFSVPLDEEGLAEYLSSMSLSEMYQQRKEVEEQMEYIGTSTLKTHYKMLIDIVGHLHACYDRNINESDINRIENIKVLDTHKDEFKALSVSVKDYRFVMFELGRIFLLIDRMEGVSSIGDVMKRLKDDEELEYIYDNIPYATEMLDKYVINRFSTEYGNFEDQKRELYNACPEAFPQFRSAGSNDSRKGTKSKGDIN